MARRATLYFFTLKMETMKSEPAMSYEAEGRHKGFPSDLVFRACRPPASEQI